MSLRAALALLLLSTAATGAEPSAQREFEAATAREGRGDFAGAARALEQLAEARPNDPFAADALFEAALIAEEHLGDPARALKRYREVAERYPQSRLERRARARVTFLSSSLRTGEAPLREYQEILSGFSARPPAESIARMERLLAAHPDFALADRALYWLGSALAANGRLAEAEARFREVEARFASSEWAGRAQRAEGDLQLRRGHPFRARAIYRDLARSGPDPLSRAAADEGLRLVARWLRRLVEALLAGGYLLVFFAYHLVALKRRRRFGQVPIEILYYFPVAVLFVLAAATENRAIGVATAGIAVGGGAVVWLSSALFTARLDESLISRAERLVRAAAVAAAVIGISFLAVQSTGLTDLVIETIKSGPER